VTSGTRRRGVEGQATVELALTLPVVAFLLLVVVQVTLVVRDHLLVTHAARAAAREAAVDRRPAEVLRSARAAAPALKPAAVTTETSYIRGSPGIVTVSVIYDAATDLPLVGPLLPDLRLVAKASLPDETDT